MAKWEKKVVFRARRAWAAVARRLIGSRSPGDGGILKLHEDVQSCGYKDVQVMFDMLTSELAAAHACKHSPSPSPSPPLPWPDCSSSSSAQ